MCISLSPAVTVEFEPTTYTVDESDCYANITVVKRRQTTQTVSVSFTTADGNATGDYVKTAEYRASLYVTPSCADFSLFLQCLRC